MRAVVRSGRRCFIVLSVACLVGATVWDDPGPGARGPESKVTKANAELIKSGMTVKQVEAILGPGKPLPASEYPTPRTRGQARIKQILERGGKGLKWEDGRKMIIVVFRGGKVVASSSRNL